MSVQLDAADRQMRKQIAVLKYLVFCRTVGSRLHAHAFRSCAGKFTDVRQGPALGVSDVRGQPGL